MFLPLVLPHSENYIKLCLWRFDDIVESLVFNWQMSKTNNLNRKVWNLLCIRYHHITNTAWKVFLLGVFQVGILTHLDWIWWLKVWISVFSSNNGKYGPEKLRIRTLFMQWKMLWSSVEVPDDLVISKSFIICFRENHLTTPKKLTSPHFSFYH